MLEPHYTGSRAWDDINEAHDDLSVNGLCWSRI